MASARTQQRRATTSQRGRRFKRSAEGGSGMRRRRRQPQPGRGQRVMQLVRGALPGGGSPARRRGSAIPVVGGLFGGKKGVTADRGRKPALLGLLGAGAAGAAMAAKRRKRSNSRQSSETQPAGDPASGSAD